MSAAHDDLKHDAAAYALGTLEPAERAAFEAHLATCAECTEEVRQLRLAAGALAHAVPQVSPPPSLRARIMNEVAGSGSAAPRADALVTLARERRGLPAWLQIAAMLVIGAGVFLYAQRMQTRVSNLEAQLAQATAQVASADRATTEARTVALRAQSAMGVFAALDVARIDLAGQPVASMARARALWSRQRGMVFTVSNLPPLPPGRVYQVWVVTAQAPVSAGLLTPDAQGGGSVYFETPVDILPPVAIAVTLEPASGVPAPTGERYLIGTPSPL
ncbi:MAG TPA: anti-sigma factor [Albitalea sp.]|nr:anti-sigma factor [Albitalea sp.]